MSSFFLLLSHSQFTEIIGMKKTENVFKSNKKNIHKSFVRFAYEMFEWTTARRKHEQNIAFELSFAK